MRFKPKNQKLNYGESGKQLCLTAILALCVFAFIFLIRDLFPLGDGSILMIDLHSQYMPLLYRFYDVVTGQKNLFLDLQASGGAYLYADTVNEILNPFNYILLLFGREKLYLAVNVLLACYGTAAAVTAVFCLQKLMPEKKEWNVPLGLMYAFAGFMGAQYQIIKWMYLFVLFPLFVLVFVRLLRDKKWGWYAVLLGYQLMLSLQLGAMTLLFSLFGSGMYLLYQKTETKEEKRHIVQALAIGTVTGMLLSAPVLIPNVLQLLHSARGSENLSYLSVMKHHGLDDLFERIYLIFHPLLFAAGCGLLGKRKTLSRESKILLIWNGFLWLTVLLQPSNLLWHLGSYRCFPVRYAYMVIFSGILLVKMLAVQTEDMGQNPEKEKRIVWSVSAFAAMFLCLAFALRLTLIWAVPISQGFSSLAISGVKSAVLKVGVCLVLMLAAGVFALLSGKWRRYAFTIAACFMGGIVFLFVMLPQDYPVRQMNEKAYEEMNAAAVRRDEQAAEEFLHREDVEGWPLNSVLISGERTMTGYFPSGNGRRYTAAMEKLGYLTPWISTRSWGGTAISDSVLGIARKSPEDFENLLFPRGMILDQTAGELNESYAETGSGDSLKAQNSLGRLLTGEDLMEIVSMENEAVLELKEKSLLYLEAEDVAANILVRVNGNVVDIPESTAAESPDRILTLGCFGSGTVEIQVTDRNGNALPAQNRTLGILSAERWSRAQESLQENAVNDCRIDDRKASIKVTAEKTGTLLLPVAYTEGWQVKVNGLLTAPVIWADGFLGVEVAEEDSVEFYFVPPGFYAGLGLFLAGIAVLVLLTVRTGKSKSGLRILMMLYLTVLLGGIMGIYLIPNAGLTIHIAKRALGIEEKEISANYPELRIAQVQKTENGIQVDLVKENLMLGRKVRVKADSAESKDFSADQVRDGITDVDSNRWSSENNWENNEHWLMVDFSESMPIVCVKLFWERTNACEYAIEYSSDQKEWITAAAFEQSAENKEQTIFLEEPVQARYLRLHVWNVRKEEADLSLYYQNVSLKELEVYGETAGSLLIEAPQFSEGTGRVLQIPELQDGYRLRFGGADYKNLIDENGRIADTLSPVEVEIGYVLEKDGLEWELPGLKTILPASETNGTAVAEAEKSASAVTVEWKADEGCTVLASEMEILVLEGIPDQDAELLSDMAELFETEIEQFTEDENEKNDSVSQIRFVLESEAENSLGEEGCEVRIQSGEICITANTPQGIRWGCVNLLDLLSKSKQLSCGTLRDYPRYEVRGFGIDVGRRAISLDLLYDMVKELSAHKMNTLQVHLNDNQIIPQSDYDGTVEGARKLYAGFRLESDLGITSTDLFYTKEDFRKLIRDAAVYGVEIVPEIDTPAHSLAITKVYPELGMDGDPEAVDMLDLSKEEARQIGKEIWSEYLSEETGSGQQAVFADCQALHLGMDEYYGDVKDYLAYLQELSDYVGGMAPEKDLRIWGSLTWKGGDLSGISRELQMHVWDTTWADPVEMYEEGFRLINSLSSHLYLIPGGGYDWLDAEYLETKWMPNVYETSERIWVLPAWSERCLGACYMMWNDWASVNGTEITEEGLFDRFAEPLPVIADKLW